MAQNILLIQEEPTDATAVREALVHSSDGPFQVEWVKRCSEALERLAGERAQGTAGFAAIWPSEGGMYGRTCEQLASRNMSSATAHATAAVRAETKPRGAPSVPLAKLEYM